ncbi:hypothetical protein [Finegoldia magna]|uniref:hypothetical protein n=1 Tax=Finegoldia magna TaxID=1260 RepID=UPI0028FED643|nr:hypothetical protein [Finegoldia magna]MDU1213047.1 hypothetical protein [Finegoldia magna]
MKIIKDRNSRYLIKIKPNSSSACTIIDGRGWTPDPQPCVNTYRKGIQIKNDK